MTKTMRQMLIAAALSMTWPGAASALTGAELQTKCRLINMVDGTRNWAQISDMNQCWSYILGVEDATFIHTFDDRKICVPDGATYGTRAQVSCWPTSTRTRPNYTGKQCTLSTMRSCRRTRVLRNRNQTARTEAGDEHHHRSDGLRRHLRSR